MSNRKFCWNLPFEKGLQAVPFSCVRLSNQHPQPFPHPLQRSRRRMMIQQLSPFPFPQPLLQPMPLPQQAQRRMMIHRMLHPQEPFPKERPHPLSHPQPLLHPQFPHPQPDLSSPHPQFVAAKSLMLLPPENVYSSSYGEDRAWVTEELTERGILAIIN